MFSDNTACVVEFTKMGDRGSQGYQGYTGWQGYTGFQGFQGMQGYQGDIINWWNTYESTYSSSSGAPADKQFKVSSGNNQIYTINCGSAGTDDLQEKLSYAVMEAYGVITIHENTPAIGFTTIKMLKDILIEMGSTSTDLLDQNHIKLLEGYIWDGQGHSITINNSYTSTTKQGQSAFFEPYWFNYIDRGQNLRTTRKHNEIKNLGFKWNSSCWNYCISLFGVISKLL